MSVDGEVARRAFDALGRAWAARSERNAFNAGFERPVLRSLLPKIAGRVVLDAGCAAGAHAEWLADHGARVVAVDVSPEMVRLAGERLGGRARVVQADLGEPLAFLDDGAVDVVLCSLTLHYLDDWTVPLAEFRRVLGPGGHLVLSLNHPFADWQLPRAEYYSRALVTEEWEGVDGHLVTVRSHRRPLADVMASLERARFVVEAIAERPPADLVRRFPEVGARLATRPWFLFLRCRADLDGSVAAGREDAGSGPPVEATP